ncbi:Epoxide hydrolase aurD [Paramyrothecium foliicola]|nr:Epoxide hydrolase aurD [Paramyrothecium foliicola]
MSKATILHTRPIRVALYGLGVVGILGTWGLAAADGTLLHLLRALHGADEYLLPGTKSLLKKSFTGIYWPVDYLLDILVVFFWEAVDGSHPAASALGIYFLAQFLPVLVAFYVDNTRAGRGFGRKLFVPTLWALSFQMAAIGCTGWIWALAFITASPTTSVPISRSSLRQASVSSPGMVFSVLTSLSVGFIAPAIVMALPSPDLTSIDFKQKALVTWNVFPVWLFVLLKASSLLFPTKQGSNFVQPKQHLRAVRWVNAITLAISSTMHVAIWAISLSTVLFPMLFSSNYAQQLSPASIFIPKPNIAGGDTVGDGVWSFFFWDQVAGYPSIAIAMLLQLRAAMVSSGASFSWTKAVGSAILGSLILGPGSVCLAISWVRDEILYATDESAEKEGPRF